MRRTFRTTVLALSLCLGAHGAFASVRATDQLELGAHSFDWTTVEEERAHFRWSAEVINGTGRSVEVVVTVDLLDDDDSIVDSDSTTVTLEAGQRRTVRDDGSLPFDRAADVVSFRFRLTPKPPERR